MKRDDIPELSSDLDEFHRTSLELLTVQVCCVNNMPVYDVYLLEPLHFHSGQSVSEAREVVREALLHLDSRGLLNRPVLGHSELVSFYPGSAQ